MIDRLPPLNVAFYGVIIEADSIAMAQQQITVKVKRSKDISGILLWIQLRYDAPLSSVSRYTHLATDSSVW